MTRSFRLGFLFSHIILLVFTLLPSQAQTIEELKAGVVKITATIKSQPQIGTGFIVKIESERAYIVTASHVVEGASLFVNFYSNPDVAYMGNVIAMDGGNPKGLALLLVQGELPKGIAPLVLNSNTTIKGGEPISLIGFPRAIGVAWAVVTGVLAGQKGLDLIVTGATIQEGNSGGPIFLEGNVVGVLTELQNNFGIAVPSSITQMALKGWGIGDIRSGPQKVTEKDESPMVLVPAGKFTMGVSSEAHEVFLKNFYIDQFEVTVERYESFLKETNRAAPKFWNDVQMERDSKKPVVGMFWDDAKAYCEWTGKRLPTEAEWEKAARGTDQRPYPWGHEYPYRENNIANFRKYEGEVKNVYLGVEDVGTYRHAKSPYGAYDMAGNVTEWVHDWYGETYYQSSPRENPQGPSQGTMKVTRGGAWNTVNYTVHSAYRWPEKPHTRSNSIGFRCAKDGP